MYRKKRKSDLSGFFFAARVRVSCSVTNCSVSFGDKLRIMRRFRRRPYCTIVHFTRNLPALPRMMWLFFPLETFCGPKRCKEAFSILKRLIWLSQKRGEEAGAHGNESSSPRLQGFERPAGSWASASDPCLDLLSVFPEHEFRLCLHTSSDGRRTPSLRSYFSLAQLWGLDIPSSCGPEIGPLGA